MTNHTASTTAQRREYVYATTCETADTFALSVAEHLAVDPHSRRPGMPGSAHYVTTLYFDSDSHEIALACAADNGDNGDNIKLRAREYFDRSSDDIWREPLLWVEVKARVGAQTRKLRFSIPSSEVQAFLSDGVITERTFAAQGSRWGQSGELVRSEIAKLCRHTDGPLRPDCVAHYRRRAWQDSSGQTRVTLDTELAFYRPPAKLFSEVFSLALAGQPVLRADHAVIEIKLAGERPSWLRELLATTKLEPRDTATPLFSKFLAASHAVAAAG